MHATRCNFWSRGLDEPVTPKSHRLFSNTLGICTTPSSTMDGPSKDNPRLKCVAVSDGSNPWSLPPQPSAAPEKPDSETEGPLLPTANIPTLTLTFRGFPPGSCAAQLYGSVSSV